MVTLKVHSKLTVCSGGAFRAGLLCFIGGAIQAGIVTRAASFSSKACLSFAFPVHLVDIWNMIEAFRDNGLNTLDHNTEINVSRLETIISSIYYQLNKRLPSTHQISVEQSISLLLNFMIAAYDRLVTALCFFFPLDVVCVAGKRTLPMPGA